MTKIAKNRRDDLTRLKNSDEDLYSLVVGMLSINPENRFTALEVITQIEDYG